MSSNAQPPRAAAEAFWERHQEYIQARDHGWGPTPVEIDVDDLIGAKGEKLAPTDEDVRGLGPLNSADPDYLSPNGNLVGNAGQDVFPYDSLLGIDGIGTGGPEEVREITERLLGRLITRKTAESVGPLQQAVDALREPLRTTAINCLYLNVDSEKAARAFGTSVETIEFLTELALDQVAAHVTLTWNIEPHPPGPR